MSGFEPGAAYSIPVEKLRVLYDAYSTKLMDRVDIEIETGASISTIRKRWRRLGWPATFGPKDSAMRGNRYRGGSGGSDFPNIAPKHEFIPVREDGPCVVCDGLHGEGA